MYNNPYLQLYRRRPNIMTSIDAINNKTVVETPVSKYSKPFDVTAKDNARMAADKVVVASRKAEMEIAVENKIDVNVTCHQGI